MNNLNLYQDIVERTNGDIYLGVVGPVRVGKSTFISNFMQTLVVPNIKDVNVQQRTIDELPQSADGKTIMTTQPKFVPNESVNITLNNNINANVRLIDCVGYLVDGALGSEEDDKPRLVKTPWTDEEMTLSKAAEIGTQKVIQDHSTIGLAITSDGSFGQIPRESFIESEMRIVDELRRAQKPFIMILNTTHPLSEETVNLAQDLSQKYQTTVLPIDVAQLNIKDINEIFEKMLQEFPLVSIDVKMPMWMQSLSYSHPLIQEVICEFKNKTDKLEKMGNFNENNLFFVESEKFEPVSAENLKMGEGKIEFEIKPKQSLFYEVLSDQCGMEILNDYHLVTYIKELAKAKVEYDKISEALLQVEETGYGVVNPKFSDMQLDEPIVVKQGGRYGVKIRASAPSLHIMKVDLETELTPLVGSQEQTDDFVKFLQTEYEKGPEQIWKANVFGRTLDELISDSMRTKLNGMPIEAQRKMRKTLTKIVNEGKGGIICILL